MYEIRASNDPVVMMAQKDISEILRTYELPKHLAISQEDFDLMVESYIYKLRADWTDVARSVIYATLSAYDLFYKDRRS